MGREGGKLSQVTNYGVPHAIVCQPPSLAPAERNTHERQALLPENSIGSVRRRTPLSLQLILCCFASLQLVDVREPDETTQGRLAEAELVPLSLLKLGTPPPSTLPRDRTTYVHCKMGGRAKIAAPMLEAMGFEKVIPLAEGYDALREFM